VILREPYAAEELAVSFGVSLARPDVLGRERDTADADEVCEEFLLQTVVEVVPHDEDFVRPGVNTPESRLARERLRVNVYAERGLELLVEPFEHALVREPILELRHQTFKPDLLVRVLRLPENVERLEVEGDVPRDWLAHKADYLRRAAGPDELRVEGVSEVCDVARVVSESVEAAPTHIFAESAYARR